MDVVSPPSPRQPGPTLLAVVGSALVVIALASMLWRGRSLEVLYARWVLHNAPTAVALLWLGRALARREPGHGLARLFLAAGVASALHVASICLADARLAAAGIEGVTLRIVPAEIPLDAAVPFWMSTWLWLIPAGTAGTLLLLLFPDGHLPSRRWRPVLPVVVGAVGLLVVAYMISSWPTATHALVTSEQPLVGDLANGLAAAGGLLLLSATVASVASLAVRWRGATGAERRQVRPVAVSGGLMAVGMVALWPWQAIWVPATMALVLAFLVTYVVAVLRFRLHDLDVAISRTVIGSVLAAQVTLVYLAVVVGVGSIVDRSAQHPLLPLLAAGLVAVLFEPARRRVRRVVDRLLYGRDADAYEVLSALAEQLRDAGPLDTVSGRVADLLVRGTGADGATITMEVDGLPRTLAETGERRGQTPALAAPIVHDGHRLGEVALHARSGSDLAPDAAALLRDVAGTLGAVLRNATLTAALQDQVEQLRRSRQRLVTAQDEARRALERDLHDGAQARLVALRLQLGLAATRAEALHGPEDVAALAATIGGLGDEADAAIRSLRDLSRGLHPPLLETDGVAAALRAAVRGLGVDVSVSADGLGRYPPQVEAAVYFSCLEACKNAVTHGGARCVRVELTDGDGWLRFTVDDDGRGFDPTRVTRGRGLTNLDDRVAGLGGRLTIEAEPGRGARVSGELPAQPLVSER